MQRYGNVPAVVNWKLNVPFGWTLPEFQSPEFEVVVWASECRLVQTTVDPTVVVSVVGLKPPDPELTIETAVPVPVLGWVGLLSLHPATANATAIARTICRIHTQWQQDRVASSRAIDND